MRIIRSVAVLAIIIGAGDAVAQTSADWSVLERARTNTAKPTSTAISVDDLRSRLFIFADDSMRGRVLGDRGNVMGTNYIAAELKRLGLEPAGENGTYFQTVPIVERAFNEASDVRVGARKLEAWKDYLMRDQGAGQRSIDGVQTVYGGVFGVQSQMISPAAAAGKVVIVSTQPGENGSGIQGLPNRGLVAAYFEHAAAVMVIGVEALPPGSIAAYKRPTGGMKQDDPTPVVSYFYINADAARAVFGGDFAGLAPGTVGTSFTGNAAFNETHARDFLDNPAYNVVGIIRGSDTALRNEYVAIGAHNDHVGTDPEPAVHDSTYVINHLFRKQGADDAPPNLSGGDVARVNAILADIRRKTGGASARIDSVYNGADDDASGSMSVLEMAEYFAGQQVKPKRSMLFIWHVGEEAGLFGSEWFTDHPTVPRESIVAQLNMDMVGRGDASDITGVTKEGAQISGSDSYVQLIGSRRLSTELGDLVEKVNTTKMHKMALDYSLDADGHPQNIYCRSDHYSYARYGIPVVFFTTGGHADYHQLTDEPQYINYPHMQKVANFVRDVAIEAANLDHRPMVDKPKPDPKGACRQ
ncbi:MAG: M28 family peptidase [Gemmatimonadetes bacterium]|nr:M28 family peptidase [Gemmatimonadota bacterium]